MERALHELPLALFTTIAPVCAGAFICLFVATLTLSNVNSALQKRLDKLSLIPVIGVFLGFIASVFHLTNPLHGIYVFSHLGTSPLSNELLVAGIFTAFMMAYILLAFMGRLQHKLRLILGALTSVSALALAVFIGRAYAMNTITTWDTPWMVVAMLGYTLAGGFALGGGVLMCAGAFKPELRTAVSAEQALPSPASQKRCALLSALLIIVGLVLGLAGTFGQYHLVQHTHTPFVLGAEYAAEMLPYFIGFVILFCVGSLSALITFLMKKHPACLAWLGTVLILLAVFCARMVFYATEISVGV